MLLTEEELKKSSVIDPSIVDFVNANPSPPLDWADAQGLRAMLAGLSQQGLEMLGPAEPTIVEEYKDIPMRDGFQSSIKIHRPASPPAGGSPLIIFCFGGGFISGDYHTATAFARAWSRLFGAVTVGISYRLAPEHKFPTSWHDAIDSAKWIAAHAGDLGADPTKGFIVGGISAGGTLSSVITLDSLAEDFAHPITGQWLCVPSLMSPETTPEKYKQYHRSLEHNTEAPVLPKSAMDVIGKHTEADAASPLRFPVLNKVPLEKLPPTYFQADGLDPLRDDALIYEEMLKEAGVKTRIDLYPGCPHAHFAFCPGIDISNKAVADIMTGMGWLLGKTISPEQGLGAMVPSVLDFGSRGCQSRVGDRVLLSTRLV